MTDPRAEPASTSPDDARRRSGRHGTRDKSEAETLLILRAADAKVRWVAILGFVQAGLTLIVACSESAEARRPSFMFLDAVLAGFLAYMMLKRFKPAAIALVIYSGLQVFLTLASAGFSAVIVRGLILTAYVVGVRSLTAIESACQHLGIDVKNLRTGALGTRPARTLTTDGHRRSRPPHDE